MALAIVK